MTAQLEHSQQKYIQNLLLRCDIICFHKHVLTSGGESVGLYGRAVMKAVRPTGGDKEMGLFEGECGNLRTDDSKLFQNTSQSSVITAKSK
jgi:hypothetical protein